jgi:late competence protein required for DNA uptake (superfamily II DNA/RNA helicase)
LSRHNPSKINEEILKLRKIVYHGLADNPNLHVVVAKAKRENKVLVYITPTSKKYTRDIIEAKTVLGDRLWIYELSMATMANLNCRSVQYYKNNLDSELYED